MSETPLDHQIQKMLSIIYQTPMGLIEADTSGKIRQINAKGVQLLMPSFLNNNLSGENITELLNIEVPEIPNLIDQFKETSGCIINQISKELNLNKNGSQAILRQYVFTVNKLDQESFLYVIDDITEFYQREKLLNEIIKEKAIEHSKFEMASGVLHDIGNAITGFASYITKIKQSIAQLDVENLNNLKSFVQSNAGAIHTAIGERKTNAVIDLIGETVDSFKSNSTHMNELILNQLNILSHIQEILNIQRQYVVGKNNARELVDLRNVVSDAKAMIFGTLDNSKIIFNITAPANLRKIKGDHTKLIQVFLNLFKNSVDSIIASQNQDKKINVSIENNEERITILITDNGLGFESDIKAQLFNRGFTTKTSGSGIGLANCKSIIEGHNGDLTLDSDGAGKGSTTTVYFNL